MALSIPVTWSAAHRRHAPSSAVWIGVAIDADELPARADRIRAALEDADAQVVDAEPHDDDALLAVHDAGLVEFLRTAWERWNAPGSPTTRGRTTLSATSSPRPDCSAGRATRAGGALGPHGAWCFDTMTVVARGTWEAARAAVDVALTAADLVLAGAPAAYA